MLTSGWVVWGCGVRRAAAGVVPPPWHGPADAHVAAQALCLREMLDLDVPYGEVFTHADRRRHRVTLSNELIAAVTETVTALRAVLTAPQLPPPLRYQPPVAWRFPPERPAT